MNLEDIKQKAVDFYDYSDDEQEKILDEIFKIASESDKNEFISEVRKLFPQIELSGIGVIYEALTKNPEYWGDFFVEEFKRAFADAEDSYNAKQILESLEEIGAMENVNFRFAHDIIRFLAQYVNHNNPVIQYYAIYYLADWLAQGNTEGHLPLIKSIENLISSHANWKIRYCSYITLYSLDILPKGVKLSWIDKLRGKFQNPYSI